MPDRIVRAAILTSDGVCSLSWPAEVFYRRLMSVVDDYGRYDGRVSVLKSHCYPLQTDKVSERDVGKWLSESAAAGLVTLYSVGEKPYLQVERFNQRIRSDSKWPAPQITKKPENVGSRSIDGKVLTDVGSPPQSAAVFVCVGADVVVGVDDPPKPPEGDSGKGFDPLKVLIPDSLESPAFRNAWSSWVRHRKEIRKPLKETMTAGQLKEMVAMGSQRAIAAIEFTISKGWQGLQEPGNAGTGNGAKNAVGNSRGYGGSVEHNRVRNPSLLDQVDRERQRAADSSGSASGGQGEMPSNGPGDGQAGF